MIISHLLPIDQELIVPNNDFVQINHLLDRNPISKGLNSLYIYAIKKVGISHIVLT